MKWRCRLKDSPSQECFNFCSDHARKYSISLLNHVQVMRGRAHFGVYGFMECSPSPARQPCFISVYIPGPFPYELTSLRNPLILKIQDVDLPKDAYVASRNVSVDKNEVRVSLRSKVHLCSQEEALVWIFGHEFFHYLTYTEQIDKPDTENNADEYGNFLLEHWRSL